MPILSCDIDSTVNDHWRRLQRNTVAGTIQPSAWSLSEVMRDQPLPGALAVLHRFKAAGWQIRYLSARHWDMPEGAVTTSWLRQHGFGYPTAEHLHLVPDMESKLEYLRNYPADLHIDDFSFGQERPGDPPPVTLRHDVIAGMPCPYEVFEPFGGGWAAIERRYFQRLPNGEDFWQFMLRNMDWWRVNRDHEARTRPAYYANFLEAVGFRGPGAPGGSRPTLPVLAEIGAGPFGGMIHGQPAARRYYVDPLANAQRVLRFVGHGPGDHFLDQAAEDMVLPERADVLLSYNALDHGWDIRQALLRAVRSSRECYLAFDCKGTGTPPHDRLDHYQTVDYGVVMRFMNTLREAGEIRELRQGDLRTLTPGFHFEHNWGFPVFWCHTINA